MVKLGAYRRDRKTGEKGLTRKVTEGNINEFGRFDALKNTADRQKVSVYFRETEGKPIPPPKVKMKFDELLRRFVVSGGFDL